MPIWLFLVILLGGLLIFGLIFDWTAKKRNKKIDLYKGAINVRESERIYTEKALDDVKRKIGDDSNYW
ncbi:hypothetical protein [Ornithinibacillus sp. 179-J 7C1 HS]|uniref:hypothetical protein n=1 Tax=Ornithinibacillus sp. 179-J 7C1 HS TaxID=3142384 RepID=UPI0039A186D4